jgi:hypothetical protein
MHPATTETAPRRWTGPVTQEGKARSSMNALKHGLTSRRVVLPGENRAEFDALVASLMDEHNPIGTLETEMVHQIAASLWRLERARAHEAALFEASFGPNPSGLAAKQFDRVSRYAGAIERELHHAIIRLQQIQQYRLKTTRQFLRPVPAPLAEPFPLRFATAESTGAPYASLSYPSSPLPVSPVRDEQDAARERDD